MELKLDVEYFKRVNGQWLCGKYFSPELDSALSLIERVVLKRRNCKLLKVYFIIAEAPVIKGGYWFSLSKVRENENQVEYFLDNGHAITLPTKFLLYISRKNKVPECIYIISVYGKGQSIK